MSKWLADFAAVAVLVPSAWIGTAHAADQSVSPHVSHARIHHYVVQDCGLCGCWTRTMSATRKSSINISRSTLYLDV